MKTNREDAVDEILKPHLDYIKSSPKLMSALYDLDFLPEQCVTAVGARHLAAFVQVWKSSKLATRGVPTYVASRASAPARVSMWHHLRDNGWDITSTWIDEAGEGKTSDFSRLWLRIVEEIRASKKVVLYAEAGDFPLKGAITECGIAIGMGKPVVVCLPGVVLEGRTSRPIGSWIEHPLVARVDSIGEAMAWQE